MAGTGNSSFSALITRTLQNHGKEIFDAVSKNNPLFYMLNKRGNVKISSGGRTFTHPIWYKLNTSFKSYAAMAAIDTPTMDDYTRADYPIKTVAGSLVIDKLEQAMNAGDPEKLIDYAKSIRTAAEKSMNYVMGEQIWKNGSVATDLDGIPYLIPDAPSTATDIGGINPTTDDYWRANLGTAIADFNTSNEGVNRMNNLYYSSVFGSEGPTCVVTTKTIFGYYELSLTGTVRHLTTELGDASFVYLAYKTLPVIFDDYCTASHIFMLDLNNLWLQILARGNFQVSDFRDSINQLAQIALMHVFCNLTTGSLRTNGVIISVAD